MKWKRRPQEHQGDYTFSGRILMTAGISEKLSQEEIHSIVHDLRTTIAQVGTVDYFQVYVHQDTGEKVWWIDNISETRRQSGELSADQLREYDYNTILLPEEY